MTRNEEAGGLSALAEKVRTLVVGYAAQADRTGAVHPEVVTAVRDAGFVRHFVPLTTGGGAGRFGEFARAVATVAEGCASTAWLASLSGTSGRLAAHLPERGRADVWADGPDALIVAAMVPAGHAEPVDGGWRIGGRWLYVSGVEFADWALLCGPAPAADGGPRDSLFFAVPRAQLRIVPSWDVVGMRATGSHTVECEDVVVPGYRTFSRERLMSGQVPVDPAGTARCHAVPLRAAGGLTFVAPALGAARSAVEVAVSAVRRSPSGGSALARAAGTVDAAELLVDRVAATLDDPSASELMLARNGRDVALAADLLRTAVNALVAAAGTSALSESHPLQRMWRDVMVATSHAALRFDTAAAEHVRLLLS